MKKIWTNEVGQKNQKRGQNALAHLGSAPEQNCTGALGKCAHAILHWRTWQVRPGRAETCLVRPWLAWSGSGRISELWCVIRANLSLSDWLLLRWMALIKSSFIDDSNQFETLYKQPPSLILFTPFFSNLMLLKLLMIMASSSSSKLN